MICPVVVVVVDGELTADLNITKSLKRPGDPPGRGREFNINYWQLFTLRPAFPFPCAWPGKTETARDSCHHSRSTTVVPTFSLLQLIYL